MCSTVAARAVMWQILAGMERPSETLEAVTNMTFAHRHRTTALFSFLAFTAAAGGPAQAGTPHEFLPEAQLLLANGACASAPQGSAEVIKLVTGHCKTVTAAQTDYREKWASPARAFFAEHVPNTIPKTVVYPFAGGDLATALTVFPDADEITTLTSR